MIDVKGLLRAWLGIYALDVRADAFDKKAALDSERLQERLAALDVRATPTDPVECPNGHTGVVRISLIEQIDSKDPSVSKVVGGGLYCPKCGVSFYYDSGKSWVPSREAPDSIQPPEGRPEAPRATAASRIRWGPRGGA